MLRVSELKGAAVPLVLTRNQRSEKNQKRKDLAKTLLMTKSTKATKARNSINICYMLIRLLPSPPSSTINYRTKPETSESKRSLKASSYIPTHCPQKSVVRSQPAVCY